MNDKLHIPVLLQEVVEILSPQPKEIIVDATLGEGGHAKALCEFAGRDIFLIGVDEDRSTLEIAKNSLKSCSCKSEFVNDNFRNMQLILGDLDLKEVDKALFDLGMSSRSLEVSGRGFSFLKDEPLLMTYDENPSGLTAKDIVNIWSEEQIELILRVYGGEAFSKNIAHSIVEERKAKPIETTSELVEVIKMSVPKWYRHKKTHPATKTFQALRVAVNDEIQSIKDGMEGAFEFLSVGGRIAVITFNSLEDKTVKKIMANWIDIDRAEFISKKAVKPSREEILKNPRSRSAKLRGIRKIN